jgi:hypothetical protein
MTFPQTLLQSLAVFQGHKYSPANPIGLIKAEQRRKCLACREIIKNFTILPAHPKMTIGVGGFLQTHNFSPSVYFPTFGGF